MERRTFTKEFKLEAVELSQKGDIPIAQLAKNLGIRPGLLYRWRSDLREDGEDAFRGKGQLKADEAELRALRRELERVRMERDILKKALSVFAQPAR